MSLIIHRQCHIAASPEQVFAVLTAFEDYPQWNPWIVEAKGECRVGEDVVVQAKLGKHSSEYHHRILAVEAPYLFHWCDEGWFTKLAYGQRKRTLQAVGGGTDYQVELRITGIMSGLVKWLYAKHLETGMTQETQALKQRAEQLYERG